MLHVVSYIVYTPDLQVQQQRKFTAWMYRSVSLVSVDFAFGGVT